VLSRWRHLDVGAQRCYLVCWLWRVKCPDCGVRVDAVPWARPGSRFTRAFEDVVAFLAQQMAKGPDPATGADRLAHRRAHPWSGSSPSASMTAALSGLERVGVDEVSYRRRHRYLTVVADHDTGRIVSLADGRNSQTLGDLFAELGDPKHSLRAISIDLSGADAKANREQLPGARIPHDPLHVVRVAADAVDQVRHDERNAHHRSHTAAGRWAKHTRWALLKAPERQSLGSLGTLGEVYLHNRRLYRAFRRYHELRLLCQLEDPTLAAAHPDGWLHWASRSRLQPFVRAARTLRRHRDGILAAIELGLANDRLEGLNSRIPLISHRSFGFHSSAPLIALIYPCRGGIVIELPLRSSHSNPRSAEGSWRASRPRRRHPAGGRRSSRTRRRSSRRSRPLSRA